MRCALVVHPLPLHLRTHPLPPCSLTLRLLRVAEAAIVTYVSHPFLYLCTTALLVVPGTSIVKSQRGKNTSPRYRDISTVCKVHISGEAERVVAKRVRALYIDTDNAPRVL